MLIKKLDGVYYLKSRKFYINNIAILELNKDNLYIYDIELKFNEADLIDDIKCDLNFDLLLGGKIYNKNKVMILKSEYHEKVIRLYDDLLYCDGMITSYINKF